MSRKLTYTINRFDGGITDNLRSGDLRKCAHVSHFDIYTDPKRLIPMPGYVSDQDTTAGGADDLQNYNVKAFYCHETLYCVGTKSNGTGSKVFSKDTAETANWTADGSEGSDDLADNTFLHYDSGVGRLYFVTNSGGSTYLSYHQLTSTTTDKVATLQSSVTTLQHVMEYAFDDNYYFNTGQDDVGKITSGTITDPAKNTAAYVTDIQSGDEVLGLLTYRFFPYKAQLLLWDSGSSLIDQKIEFGSGREGALGYPAGTWVGVLNESLDPTSTAFQEEANGEYSLAVKYAAAGGARTMVRLYGKTNTNGVLKPLRSKHKDSMLFYARIPQDSTPTTYKEGIWAIGKCRDDSPLALSLLLDTGDLGLVEGHYAFGKHHYFAHNEDGSVSRLDNISTGTYDVDAEYHTLFFGSDTPNLKELNGIGVLTEDLPSGGSVTAYYRFDEDDAWTSLGSSSTTGAEKHQFRAPSGVSIGRFREIQFRIVVSGKVIIKNIICSLNETDDLGFDI